MSKINIDVLLFKEGLQMILGLHHAQITIPVGSEKEGKDFYCGILGLSEIEKPNSLKLRGGFWLLVGNLEVHIGTEDGFNRLTTKAHLAYEVKSISQWRKKIQNHRIEIIESIPIPGFERFEFKDPFGNRVELIERVN